MNKSFQLNKNKLSNAFKPKTTKPTINSKNMSVSYTESPNRQKDYDEVNEALQGLLRMQKQCEQRGKYVEAQSYKRQIKELKQQLQRQQYTQLISKHHQQRQQIQYAHNDQMLAFNNKWDKQFSQLIEQVKNMQDELIARHEEQFKEYRMMENEQYANDRNNRFRQSAQLLNLKKIEQELAKQQNYIEAHQVQQQAQKLEKQQYEKWKYQQGFKERNLTGNIKAKQDNELKAMKQRIQLLIDQRNKQRKQEQQTLNLKYQNVIKQLEYQQTQQMLKFNKNAKLSQIQKKTTVKFSTSGVMSRSKLTMK